MTFSVHYLSPNPHQFTTMHCNALKMHKNALFCVTFNTFIRFGHSKPAKLFLKWHEKGKIPVLGKPTHMLAVMFIEPNTSDPTFKRPAQRIPIWFSVSDCFVLAPAIFLMSPKWTFTTESREWTILNNLTFNSFQPVHTRKSRGITKQNNARKFWICRQILSWWNLKY